MTDKTFIYGDKTLTLKDPGQVDFSSGFHEQLYKLLFDRVTAVSPHIDFDSLNASFGIDIYQLAKAHGVKVAAKDTDNEWKRNSKAMHTFLKEHPEFFNFLQNSTAADAAITIQAAEWIEGGKTSNSNFVSIKKHIDDWNKLRWTRTLSVSESQSGVSVLGGISETLIETALESFIDDATFFKNNTSKVESYGDFVLMCLPNNLWISVKSNFARERLLASGFTTDIIGAGFFTDSTEFTSGSKVRNFQKVGFLAMYVPDISITESQVQNNTSTYSEIESFYQQADTPQWPMNINGQPFIRRLSALSSDLEALLSVKSVKKRTTIGF